MSSTATKIFNYSAQNIIKQKTTKIWFLFQTQDDRCPLILFETQNMIAILLSLLGDPHGPLLPLKNGTCAGTDY